MIHNPRILIVDHDPDIRQRLRDLLEHDGYRVDEAATGAETLDRVSRSRYAAMVLDLRLPDLDGQTVLRQCLASDPKLPVIVSTGSLPDSSHAGSLTQGAFAYMTTPHSPMEIKTALRQAVGLRTLEQRSAALQSALTEHEHRFQAMVESSPDAIILADHSGAIQSWNRSAGQMFGYRTDEVIGRPLTMLMPEPYRDAHTRGFERMRSTGEGRVLGRTVELEGLRADGSTFPLELSLSTWTTDQGRFYAGIIRDISDRKRADRVLRESRERFQQVTENIREVFWLTDPDKKEMIYISPGYEEIWGRSCESLYATPGSWLEALHPDDRAWVRDAAMTRQTTGEYDVEYRIVRPDGSTRWIHDRAFPIKDEGGRITRIAGVADDITDRKRALDALQHAHRSMGSILTSLPVAIILVNESMNVEFMNPSARTSFEAGNSSHDGRPLHDLLPLSGSQWDRLEASLRGTLASPTSPQGEAEFELRGSTYRYRPFSIIGAPGFATQIGLVIHDITEQKHLQEHLFQAEKLASLGTLVSGMAHEINNPMQSILGMAELLDESTEPSQIKDFAGAITECARHVATVVRDFCSYARPSSRDRESNISLEERLVEAVKMVQRGPHFGHVEVVTEFVSAPRIRARRTEIDQVFVNLVSNAVQAMPGAGRLTLTTRSDGVHVVATISDTGPGIPPHVRQRIFDPFFTTKEPGEGTGLGLSIAHSIVAKYHGSIAVQSEEGCGASFTLSFPIRRGEESVA